MTNLVVMGECMVEFSPTTDGQYKQSFAGDVYNTAVYLKRLLAEASNVSLFSAVGKDFLSEKMLQSLTLENISSDFVEQSDFQQMGAYLIQTSAEGERSFVYWRDTSAAKTTLSSLGDESKKELIRQTDIFYFSGISLAILKPLDRQLFWQLLGQLKKAGVRIVFDSNYRAKLWQNCEEAKGQFEQAFRYAHVVFPGVEDFELLYGFNSFEAIAKHLEPLAIDEVIKDLSLEIPANKITAIVGASGSGKTTLMKILLKFYEVSKGDIKVGPADINSISQHYW